MDPDPGQGPPAPTYRDNIPALDGLRGIAILLVIWVHLRRHLMAELAGSSWGLWLFHADLRVMPGYLGVDIFFVLSGFLITRILLTDRARGRPLRHFLARRCLRIFPIYYLTLAVVWWFRTGPEVKWCALYVCNFVFPFEAQSSPLNHTWSLAVEEHFYLLWPLLVFLLPRERARRTALYGIVPLALVAGLVTVHLMDTGVGRRVLYMQTPFRMCSLGLGAVLAFHEPRIRLRPGRWFVLALATFVLGQCLVQMLVIGHKNDPYCAWFRLLGFALVSTGIVLAGISRRNSGGVVIRMLGSRPLGFVGMVSYGLYLYHVPLFDLFFTRFGSSGAVAAVATAAAFATAVLSYYALERPLLRLKKRFQEPRPPPAP